MCVLLIKNNFADFQYSAGKKHPRFHPVIGGVSLHRHLLLGNQDEKDGQMYPSLSILIIYIIVISHGYITLIRTDI